MGKTAIFVYVYVYQKTKNASDMGQIAIFDFEKKSKHPKFADGMGKTAKIFKRIINAYIFFQGKFIIVHGRTVLVVQLYYFIILWPKWDNQQ